jgi:hypothetical protein
MRGRWLNLVLLVATVAVLAASVPGAWRDVVERGGFYIFSDAFLVELPRRLTGPGRLLLPAGGEEDGEGERGGASGDVHVNSGKRPPGDGKTFGMPGG